MQRLDAIDARLKALMPAEDFRAIASPRSTQYTASDFDVSFFVVSAREGLREKHDKMYEFTKYISNHVKS